MPGANGLDPALANPSCGSLTAIRTSIVKWHTDVPSDCAKGMPALDRLGRQRLSRS